METASACSQKIDPAQTPAPKPLEDATGTIHLPEPSPDSFIGPYQRAPSLAMMDHPISLESSTPVPALPVIRISSSLRRAHARPESSELSHRNLHVTVLSFNRNDSANTLSL
jgi:hypothetical protein